MDWEEVAPSLQRIKVDNHYHYRGLTGGGSYGYAVPIDKKIVPKAVQEPVDGWETEFDKFWNLYPRAGKTNKRKSKELFQVKVRNFNKFFIATKSYLRHLETEEWKRAKDSTTWLNNWDGWEIQSEKKTGKGLTLAEFKNRV